MATDAAFPLFLDVMVVQILDTNGVPMTGPNTSYTVGAISVEYKPTYLGGDLKTKVDGRGAVCFSVKTIKTQSGETLDVVLCGEDDELRWATCGGTLTRTMINTVSVTTGYNPPAGGTEGRPNGVAIIGYTDEYLGQSPASDAVAGSVGCYVWPKVKFVDPGMKYSADSGDITINGDCFLNPGYTTPPTGWQGGPLTNVYHGRSRMKRANLPVAAAGLNLV